MLTFCYFCLRVLDFSCVTVFVWVYYNIYCLHIRTLVKVFFLCKHYPEKWSCSCSQVKHWYFDKHELFLSIGLQWAFILSFLYNTIIFISDFMHRLKAVLKLHICWKYVTFLCQWQFWGSPDWTSQYCRGWFSVISPHGSAACSAKSDLIRNRMHQWKRSKLRSANGVKQQWKKINQRDELGTRFSRRSLSIGLITMLTKIFSDLKYSRI